MKPRVAAILALATLAGTATTAAAQSPVLALRFVADGEPASVRVRLRNSAGTDVVPPGAVPLFGVCRDLEAPLTAGEFAATSRTDFAHARTAGTEFYVTGELRAEVAPGRYTVRVEHGNEFRVVEFALEVPERGPVEQEIQLERWVDMASEGWLSGDGHLHVGRPSAANDEAILAWLAAEDLDFGHLLQWGNARGFHNALQVDAEAIRGVDAAHGSTILVGQENPRTPFLGHLMALGVPERVSLESDYLNYTRFAIELRRAGGLVGIGHSGEWGGDAAAALLGAWDLLDFIEVFTFRTPDYDLWYETLNAGLDVAATAGSDFPCGGGQVPPGWPRFYAKVQPGEDWSAAVARGRTFVTNGPVLEFDVAGRAAGDVHRLPEPGSVTVRGRLRFDPDQESLRAFDLLRNGEVIAVYDTETAPGEVAFETEVSVHEASWFAVRAFGRKRAAEPRWRNAFAHSGVVRVEIDGRPRATEVQRARAVRRLWRSRLEALFARLADPSQHTAMARASTDSADSPRFGEYAIRLLREIDRTLRYAGLER